MDNKALQNLIKNILTFLVIFLIVNFIFNSFFNNKESGIPASGIIFKTADSISLRENLTVTLQNNTAADITLPDTCPAAPLQVQRLTNGAWQDVSFNADISCENTQSTIVKAGSEFKISFNHWGYELFKEKGDYKVLLTLPDKVLESNTFKVKDISFFGWLWTVLLYQPIYNALMLFAGFLPFHDFGLAIILLTIIIRTLLLLPNQKALKSQKKLQEIQPKISELNEKHKGDKEKIALETMAIYREHKVNPFGSCLPILIQLPILIALFYVIQSGLDAGHKHLLYPFLAATDLNSINTNFLGLMELTRPEMFFLPVIVGGLQYLQMRMSLARGKKKSPEKKTSSEMDIANKTMTVTMPLMIAVFTATTPAGVGLYWAFSTLYAIGQQYVINSQWDKKKTKIRVLPEGNKAKKEHYQKLNEERKRETDKSENDSAQ